MSLFLDSALMQEAREAASLGFVWGATTNPLLMAAAQAPPTEVIAALCELLPGTVFHQLSAGSASGREREARQFLELRPGRVGLKIPCRLDNLALASRLAAEGHIIGITAIFSPAQCYLACEAGARYVLPYVNRTTRLLGDGPGLVAEMRAVIDALGAPTEIIAASVKSPGEAVATLSAGAHHLTLPLAVIKAMAGHPLSEDAIAEFARCQPSSGSTNAPAPSGSA